jgi:hypothetical protein
VAPGASLDTVEKRKFFILPGLALRLLGQTRNGRLWIARDSKEYFHQLDDDIDTDDSGGDHTLS